jgi:hypothetical protein
MSKKILIDEQLLIDIAALLHEVEDYNESVISYPSITDECRDFVDKINKTISEDGFSAWPTEEMIQAGCISQYQPLPGEFFTTYGVWANNTSTGTVDRIRSMLISEYKAMIGARPK